MTTTSSSTASSSMTRYAGLSGIDVDSLVKTAMKGYQTKVDQQIQKRDVLEIKQKLYRQVLTDTRSFYNKYIDIAKSDSLMLSSNYKAVSFKSDNEGAVTAKALSGAKIDNYTVDVTSIAKPSSLTIDDSKIVAGNKIKIQGIEFELEGASKTEIATNLTNSLKAKGISINARYTQFSTNSTTGMVLESSVLGASSPDFTAQVMGTATTNNLDVTSGTDTAEAFSNNIAPGNIVAGNMITVNGKQFKLTGANGDEINTNLNAALDSAGIKVNATYNDTDGMKLTADDKGAANNFTASIRVYTESPETEMKASVDGTKGTDAGITVTNSKGEKYTYTGNANTFTVDDVVFTVNQKPTSSVTLSGKSDTTDIKDKIVKFVNDYNTMITNLNKDIMIKHDRNYSPLTSDQKEAMSESQIKLWDEKVETGQLYRDSDISRITSSMKEAMRSVMDGSGMTLEKIGITPVKDYAGTTNGTFAIDEEKLTSALQNNIEDVKDLFIGQPDATATTDAEKNSQTGILNKLKSNLYSEVMKSDSALAKKVGIEGTASFTTNTITKSISDYEKKITNMQKALATRQQALYSKYANIEEMMNKYNSQQSYLASSLGS
ncbi:flagellar filament capping protein FliD [Clostridium saccharobutylicum]|uniref:Flagellar hook-associated protein 2 n=1 Tax=Clostridium saccharobutylicum TaxID=169679 RepID=A0A1S8NIS9_CLOSA|nr:flagellar filament capping protein FliD [Clostridium saccharobutylicum]OOM16272.1 flagellar capping protein [Clostridium saccharobutylicum]